MKSVLFIILTFLCLSNLQASRWTIKGKSPYELKVLVESFNVGFLTEEEKQSLKAQINELDALLGSLDEKDRFFIAKSTVYRWVLRSSPFSEVPSNFKIQDFKTIEDTKDLSPFAKWLLLSIKSDVANLVSLPEYKAYDQEKEKKGRTVRYKAVERRVNLIRPWAYLFSSTSSSQVSLRLMKYQFILLKNLISQYRLFHRFQNKELPRPNQKLSYFSFGEIKNEDQAEKQDRALSDLDQLIEKHKKKNLPLPVNDWEVADADNWVPKEDPEMRMKIERNIRNPSPNPNYKAPKDLPKPVNDWDE